VLFGGKDLLKLPTEEIRKVHGKRIGMIFQDPMSSLNPFMRISRQLMEVTELHMGHSSKQAREHAVKCSTSSASPMRRRASIVILTSFPEACGSA
jgi:oligopeptide transport system ATP-binding protein